MVKIGTRALKISVHLRFDPKITVEFEHIDQKCFRQAYYVVITNDFDKLLALDNLLDSQTLMPLIECSLSLIICEATAFCFIFLAEGDLLFCGNNNLDGENGKTLQHHVQLPHSNRIMIFLE